MNEFVTTYPESPKVFSALDYIAQIQALQEKQPEEAIATYEQYVTKYPDSAEAPTAILKISDLWRKTADGMGRYITIPKSKQADWKAAVDNSVAAAERILEKYPASPEVALALQNLLAAQKHYVLAHLKADSNVESYFNELAAKYADQPATASRIKFTLAGYFSEKDKEKALEMMKKAYDKELVYAPADLDVYAGTLIEQKRYDDVLAIAEKLVRDYPLPEKADVEKLPSSVTEPHALALFYTAKVLQLTGKNEESARKSEQLKKQFPWSPKLLETDYLIAVNQYERKEYEEALKLLAPIARATTGPADIRARSMMMMARIAEARGDINSAINNYIKIALVYEGVPELAAEGLWLGAQLQEKKASGAVKHQPPATPANAAPAAAPTAAK